MERKGFFQIEKVLKNLLALLLVAGAALSLGCSDDVDDGKSGGWTNGVILPTVVERTIKSDGGSPTVTFETKDAFTLSVKDDEEMIEELKLNNHLSTSGKAGMQSLAVVVGKNSGDSERTATIYITVNGYEKVRLVVFTQKTTSEGMDEVVKYMDERLKTEYYWLDEYNQKWNSFDFTVDSRDEEGYNEVLGRTIGSMTTNFDFANHLVDGGQDDGERYLYTNVMMIPDAEHSSATRAGGEKRYGYGFDVCTIVLQIEGGRTPNDTSDDFYAFLVDHVYPNSPASGTGLRRSDYITKVNGQSISRSTYYEAAYSLLMQDEQSISLEKRDWNTGEKADITISRREFKANPVAYYGILEVPEQINTSGKKIGYMSYVSFDGEGDDKMVEAIASLVADGAEEMILDLRSNGGGSVISAVKLSSMLVSESYVGQVCCKLKRNEANKYGDDVYEFMQTNEGTSYNEGDGSNLPNLNVQKVYIIVSDGTASASEMVIQALRGIDVEVELIGATTEGKNCGMDVTEKKIGSYWYVFSPITFFNFNAKDDYRYCQGITPERDLVAEYDALYEKYGSEAAASPFYYYPLPVALWGDVEGDIALLEAVSRINGTTQLGVWEPEEESPEEASTRAVSKPVVKKVKRMPQLINACKPWGAKLSEEDRKLRRAAQEE